MSTSGLLQAALLYGFVGIAAAVLFPCVNRLLGLRPALAWSMARAFVLLAVGSISFILGHAGVPLSPKLLAAFALGGLAVWSLVLRRSDAGRLPGAGTLAVIEGAALAAFVGVLLIRSAHAEIAGAEKFWDFALLNSVLRAGSFPVEDPWFAGFAVNYYYLGHAAAAWPLALLGVDPSVGYAASLGLWYSAAMAAAAGLGIWSVGRAWGGALAGFAVLVMGNLHGAVQAASHGALLPFDYWPSSRIIPGTINEFPFFSFYHGDLHPHLLNVPFVLLCVALGGSLFCRAGLAGDGVAPTPGGAAWRAAAGAVLLGGAFAVNSWDAAGLGLLAVFVLLGSTGLRRVAMLGSCAGGVLLFLPFFLRLQNPFYGFDFVRPGDGSLLRDLVVEWGLLAAVPAGVAAYHAFTAGRRGRAVLAGIVLVAVTAEGYRGAWIFGSLSVLLALRARSLKEPSERYFHLVAAAGLALIAIPELLFARDAFSGELQRMNTVFKLHYEAWTLLGVSMPALLRSILICLVRHGTVPVEKVTAPDSPGSAEAERPAERPGSPARHGRAGVRLWKRAPAVLFFSLLAAHAVYPVLTTADRFYTARGPLTLDGLRYLSADRPHERDAIEYLRKHEQEIRARLLAPGRARTARLVVLEATGEPYGYFARVSSFTGIPTVLGWENHERVWRKDCGKRGPDVDAMFSSPDLAVFRDLGVRQYGVNLVYIGDLERSLYAEESLAKFEAGMLLFSNPGVRIFGFPEQGP